MMELSTSSRVSPYQPVGFLWWHLSSFLSYSRAREARNQSKHGSNEGKHENKNVQSSNRGTTDWFSAVVIAHVPCYIP